MIPISVTNIKLVTLEDIFIGENFNGIEIFFVIFVSRRTTEIGVDVAFVFPPVMIEHIEEGEEFFVP